MSVPLPRRPDDKAGGDAYLGKTEKTPVDLFRALAGRLVRVPVAEMREAERLHAIRKAAQEPDS